MNKLYKRFAHIENMMMRGLITVKDGNELMLNAIKEEFDEYCDKNLNGSGTNYEWDSMKAYHKMYLILAKLTRD